MANYIIIKNTLEHSFNFGKIKKIELTEIGGGMFMQIHALIRKEYDNGFFDCAFPFTDRKKRKMATVTIFKHDARMSMGFEYSLQNKKIDFKAIEVEPVNDSICPHCGNDEIDYDGDRSFDDGEAHQEVFCPVCDCHWVNVYKFNGVQIIN